MIVSGSSDDPSTYDGDSSTDGAAVGNTAVYGGGRTGILYDRPAFGWMPAAADDDDEGPPSWTAASQLSTRCT